jgi:hypothetical protein
MRVALLVLLAGCSYVYLLLIARFFRPAHVLRMLKADIPRVRSLGAEIAGNRGQVEFVQSATRLAEERVDESDAAPQSGEREERTSHER